MPSDAKKKQQQKKKDAAKARQSGKKPVSTGQKSTEDEKEPSPPAGNVQNGTNGTAISEEGEPRAYTIKMLQSIVLHNEFKCLTL